MSSEFLVCKGCMERHMKCHSDCEKYLSAKRSYDERMQAVRMEKGKTNTLHSYKLDSIRKELRRKQR